MLQISVDVGMYNQLMQKKGKRTWYQFLNDEIILQKSIVKELKEREQHWQKIYAQLKKQNKPNNNIKEESKGPEQIICYICNKPTPETCSIKIGRKNLCTNCYSKYKKSLTKDEIHISK